jgi:hypothetical protein
MRSGLRPSKEPAMNASSIIWAVLALILFLVMLRVFGVI